MNKLLSILLLCTFLLSLSGSARANTINGIITSPSSAQISEFNSTVQTVNLVPASGGAPKFELINEDVLNIALRSPSDRKTFGALGKLDAPLTLKALINGKPVQLIIPAHRTIVYTNVSGIQINVKNSSLGKIVVSTANTLILPPDSSTSYESIRISNQMAIAQIATLVSEKKYAEARSRLSQLLKMNELYSSDVKAIAEQIALMPAAEQPISLYMGDVRLLSESLNATFMGQDFDQMTKKEFLEFAQEWAKKPSSDLTTGDETYLLRILRFVDITEDLQIDLAKMVIESRLALFIENANAGMNPLEVSTTNEYVADVAFGFLNHQKSDKAAAYITELKARATALDPKIQQFLRSMTSMGYDLFGAE